MYEPLLEAGPSFRDDWNEFLREWSGKPVPLPYYLVLANLARHLMWRLESGDTARFPDLFRGVGRWHVEGDDYVREASIIGLLEDLQNGNLHKTTAPADFLPWLSPESLRWWKKVQNFWCDGTIIRDD